MCNGISNKEGFVIPIINHFFRFLEKYSILTCLKNRKPVWEKSRFLVDAYVLCWLILSIVYIFAFHYWHSFAGNYLAYNILIVLILVLAIYRLVDISQAWWNRYFVPPYEAKAPRNIILTFMNYWEIIVAFAIVGLFFNWPPYYPEGGQGVSGWAIMTALRESVRIASSLGLRREPPTLWSGALFWVEFFFGFFFLAVIITVVVSYLRNNHKAATRKSKSKG